MDLTGPGVTYLLFLIPAVFAVTVLLQGFAKLVNGEPDGPVALGFGVGLIALVGITFFLFIR